MTAPPCPSCTRPVTGPHRLDESGSAWHIGCWERENPERDNQRSPDQFGLALSKEGE